MPRFGRNTASATDTTHQTARATLTPLEMVTLTSMGVGSPSRWGNSGDVGSVTVASVSEE